MTHTIHLPERRVPWLVPALWLALLLLTAATWMYDEAGMSFGMPPALFFVILVSPVVVAAYYGWWQDSPGKGLLVGMAAGALFGLANMLGHLLWAGVLFALGRVPPSPSLSFIDFAAEAAAFTVMFTFVGLVLGAAGGLTGAWAARRWR